MPSRTDAPAAAIDAAAAAIAPPDAEAEARARARQDQLTKPPGALGRLEELSVRIAAMRGCARPRLEQRLVVVAAADHGVAARGVSAYPPEVTAQMVANFLAGGAAINVLADHAGARVRVVDAGVLHAAEGGTPELDEPGGPALVRLDLPRGSGDITDGPAMSREIGGARDRRRDRAGRGRAAGAGARHRRLRRDGYRQQHRGSRADRRSDRAVRRGRHRPRQRRRGTRPARENRGGRGGARREPSWIREDGVALLAALGGHEIGVLAGIYLGAAAARIPAVMDGLISGAAALVAAAIAPGVRDYVVASHRSPEPGHAAVLEALEAVPLLDLGMRLGEGSGAALGISLCVAACRLLDEMATFGEAGVSEAPPE